jgi:two-component system chemotaxis response regulator CheB
MIVDDSALMRKLLSDTLQRDSAIEVIDTAMDGQFALDHLARVKPDVILMDVDMPRLDGLGALDRIVAEYGLPVVMCSAQTTAGAKATIEALARGAVDFIEKPDLALLKSGEATANIAAKVRSAMTARVSPSRRRRVVERRPALPAQTPPAPINDDNWHKTIEQISGLAHGSMPEIIAIGTSTGGPPALEQVLMGLPADFPLGIVIVQHMPPGFTQQLANHLDRNCQITVREAEHLQPVEPGVALIARGGAHLNVIRKAGGYAVTLDEHTPPISGHRPSVDVLFDSVARSAGKRAAAFIMTGMGSDGANAMGELARAGAVTVAQTPDSCVCFGMPKSAMDRGHARAVIPLDGIASAIVACGAATRVSRPNYKIERSS